MDVLIRYGFSIEEIKNMMDTNDSIESIPDKEILEFLNILTDIGCHEEHIMNILSCNPFSISRNNFEIKKLFNKLNEIGIKDICSLIDSNPYILNLNDIDIDVICNKLISDGLSENELANYFYNNIVL